MGTGAKAVQASLKFFKEIESSLLLIVKNAGKTLLGYSPRVEKPEYDGTDIDLILDQQIKEGLKRLLDIPILSEESTSNSLEQSDYIWIIDPLDGTMNALVGNPNVVISIALFDAHKMQPVLSTVFAPFHQKCFHAVLNGGAFLNGEKIVSTPNPNLPKILSIGLPSDAYKKSDEFGNYFKTLIEKGWVLRQNGSAALDICWTVLGHWRAFQQFGLYIWDIGGADLIVSESGYLSYYKRSVFSSEQDKYRVDYIACENRKTLHELDNVFIY